MNNELSYTTHQHSVLASFLLHILPGALVTVAFILFKSLFAGEKYPPLFAFLLAILIIDLPLLWGIMLNEGKKLNGRFSLKGVVLYRDKVSLGTFLLIFIGAFVVVFALITLVGPSMHL